MQSHFQARTGKKKKKTKLKNKALFSPHCLRLPEDSAPSRRRRRPNHQGGGPRRPPSRAPRHLFFSLSRAGRLSKHWKTSELLSIRHPDEDFFTQLHFFRAAEPRPIAAAAANGRGEPPLNEPEAEPRGPAPSLGRTAGLTTRAPAGWVPRPRPACACSRFVSQRPPARGRVLSPTPGPPHGRPLFPQTSWAPRRPFLRPPLPDVTDSSTSIRAGSFPFLGGFGQLQLRNFPGPSSFPPHLPSLPTPSLPSRSPKLLDSQMFPVFPHLEILLS